MTTTKLTSIAVKPANAQRIAAALDKINGRARFHTASAGDVFRAARHAEDRLTALGVPARDRAGAVCDYVSGREVKRAYKYDRRLNTVKLLRRTTGWTMSEVEIWDAGVGAKPGILLTLTAAQDALAVGKLRTLYRFTAAPTATVAAAAVQQEDAR